MALRLVMMGTGDFALPTFLGLFDSGHHVVGLFTQPDRTGRGHHHHVNPLKEAALTRNVPVFQPEKVNAPESLSELRSLKPDLCVVAAYGQILSAELLQIPRLGAVNLHASLLPKYRGAAPVQYAVLNGEAETGVTIFQIEPRLDAGPMLAVAKTPIGRKETAGELETRLAEISVNLTCGVLNKLEVGTVQPIVQDTTGVTRAPRIPKSFGEIDWTKSAAQIDWHVRAMQPWPMAYSTLDFGNGKSMRLILVEVEPIEDDDARAEPGTVIATDGDRLVVQTGNGGLRVILLRPDGKKTMRSEEFARGHQIRPGMRFLPTT